MDKKFFNPDVQIDGSYDVDALAAAEVRGRKNGEFDADEIIATFQNTHSTKISRYGN